MTHLAVDIRPYQPGTPLDDQLAELGYACLHGWPDQRPITPSLVRSRLRPPTRTSAPTTLATIHTATGQLIAAAALRHPPAPDTTGRLWGPAVHPQHQRRGLGTRLLDSLADLITHFPGIAATAEIPTQRSAALAFFTHHGWDSMPPATLLKAELPLGHDTTTPQRGVAVRALSEGEDLTNPLARLYMAARPHEGSAVAQDAFTRWTADERFCRDGLALAEVNGELAAAALVYPLAHTRPGEPAEALVGDILLSPSAGPDRHMAHTAVRHALSAATARGAAVARAVVSHHEAVAHQRLTELGFRPVSTLQYFRPPPSRPRPLVRRRSSLS